MAAKPGFVNPVWLIRPGAGWQLGKAAEHFVYTPPKTLLTYLSSLCDVHVNYHIVWRQL